MMNARAWGIAGVLAGLLALVLFLVGGGRGGVDLEQPASRHELESQGKAEAQAGALAKVSAGTETRPSEPRHDPGSMAATDEPPAPAVASEGTTPAASPAPKQATRLAGRVVDARTGEAVPELEVTVRGAGFRREERTDENGGFEVETAVGDEPTVEIQLTDMGLPVDTLHADAREAPWTLRVLVGPTYPLDLRQAHVGEAALRATLRESIRDEGVAGALRVGHEGIVVDEAYRERPDRKWSWVPVHEGMVPWVRFPRAEHAFDDRYALSLIVRSEKSGREAWGGVESTVGQQPAVQPVLRRTTGSLVGRVLGEQGRHRPVEGIRVLLVPAAEDDSPGPPAWNETFTDEEGAFAFHGLALGTRRLAVPWGVTPPVSRDVVVRAGTNVPQELRVEPHYPDIWVGDSPRDQGIQVQLTYWQRAEDPGRVCLIAEMEEFAPFARRWSTHDGYRDGDRQDRSVGALSLPRAAYRFRAMGFGGPPRLWPASWRIEDSFEERVRWVAPRERVPFGLLCEAAATGEVLPGEVFFGPGGHLWNVRSYPSPWSFPPDVELEWMAGSPGYAPRYGNASAFREEGGRRVATVVLERGWGASLHVRAGDPTTFEDRPGPWTGWTFPAATYNVGMLLAPPVRGVEVFADGVLVGTSDATGALRLSLPGTPQRLVLRCPGWRLVELTSSWGDGWARPYVLWMEPESPSPVR